MIFHLSTQSSEGARAKICNGFYQKEKLITNIEQPHFSYSERSQDGLLENIF